MKKLGVSILIMFCIASAKLFAVITGSGTSTDPYVLHTESDLITIMATQSYWNSGVYIEMANNLNMSGYTCNPIGIYNPWGTNYPFYGVFNGNGFTINNLTINSTYKIALFTIIGTGGIVKNLKVVNANISGLHWNAILCGDNNGTILNCYCSGNTSSTYGGCVAGLCWQNFGTIDGCGADVNVSSASGDCAGFCGMNDGYINKCYSIGNVTGNGSYMGGFVARNGYDYTGIIRNSYSTGNVTMNVQGHYLGGFCGMNANSTIEYCFSTGVPSGGIDSYRGGFIGLSWGTLNCNFWGFPGANLYDIGFYDFDDSQIKELTVSEFADWSNFPCYDISIWARGDSHPVFIPTLSEWAAIIFIGMIGIIGGWTIFRKIV